MGERKRARASGHAEGMRGSEHAGARWADVRERACDSGRRVCAASRIRREIFVGDRWTLVDLKIKGKKDNI